MKKIYAIAASFVVFSPALFTLPVHARCEDRISYMIDKAGRCIDLTALTQLSAIERKIATIEKQSNPLVFNRLALQEDGKNIHSLNGTVVNQSQQTVITTSFDVDFTTKRDGNIVIVRSVSIPFGRVILPGKVATVDYSLLGDDFSEGLDVVVRNVNYKSY